MNDIIRISLENCKIATSRFFINVVGLVRKYKKRNKCELTFLVMFKSLTGTL